MPNPVVRADINHPCPGYAHTREVSRHPGATQARDALMRYASALVRLGLAPAWGVRMFHHRVSERQWVYVVMLDGPEVGWPAELEREGATLRMISYTHPTPTPPTPTPAQPLLNGRPVADAITFL